MKERLARGTKVLTVGGPSAGEWGVIAAWGVSPEGDEYRVNRPGDMQGLSYIPGEFLGTFYREELMTEEEVNR